MEEINLDPEVLPIYTSIKHQGKMRKVRRFGAVTLHTKDGKKKVIWPEGYLFIKNEPNTVYTLTCEDTFITKQKKENEKNGQQEGMDIRGPSREHKSFKAMFRES